MNKPKLYAENIGNYWQTSKSSAESWINKAKKEIRSIGGKIINELYGMDDAGLSAFSLVFQLGPDTFKIVWSVLPSKTGNEKAAKVQAATMLYHDVKHKVIMAKVKGTRTSFFEYLMLPNGQIASAVSGDQLLDLAPQMLLSSGK